mgnify:CR=1 FL=1
MSGRNALKTRRRPIVGGGSGALEGTESVRRVFQGDKVTVSEAQVKAQLQELRTIAEVRLRSGTVPDWSWPQHVQLIEAVDAMLHDISVTEAAPHSKRHAAGALRLVTDNPERPTARRRIGSLR